MIGKEEKQLLEAAPLCCSLKKILVLDNCQLRFQCLSSQIRKKKGNSQSSHAHRHPALIIPKRKLSKFAQTICNVSRRKRNLS